MGVHRVVRGVAPRRLDPVAEHREQPQIEQGGAVPARPAGQFVLPREEREPPRGVPEQLRHRHRQRLLDRGESGGHRVQLVLRRRPQPVRVRRRQLPGRGLGDGGVAPGAAAEPQAQPGRQQFRVADHRVAGAAGPAAPVQGGPPLEEDGRSAPGDDADAARAGRRAGVRHPEQRAQLTAEGVRALGRAGVRDRRHARTGTAPVAVPAEDHLVQPPGPVRAVHAGGPGHRIAPARLVIPVGPVPALVPVSAHASVTALVPVPVQASVTALVPAVPLRPVPALVPLAPVRPVPAPAQVPVLGPAGPAASIPPVSLRVSVEGVVHCASLPTPNDAAPPGASMIPCIASSDTRGSSTRRGRAPAG